MNLLFDLYGVLIRHRTPEIRRTINERLQLPHPERHWDAYHDLREPIDEGKVDDVAWWAQVAQASGFPELDIAEAMRIEEETLTNPYEEAVALVRGLLADGVRVGVLSNLPHALANALVARHEWFAEFTAVTFSCDIGVAKPKAAAYQEALRALQAAPEETIFFDDTLANVTAAEALGIHGVHYTGPESITQALEKDWR